MLILYICFQIVGSKALWSLCLLLYVLPTQNKSCLVLSCLVFNFCREEGGEGVDRVVWVTVNMVFRPTITTILTTAEQQSI